MYGLITFKDNHLILYEKKKLHLQFIYKLLNDFILINIFTFQEKIRWNDRSRKIILFATDGIFHYAGDGKVNHTIILNFIVLLFLCVLD